MKYLILLLFLTACSGGGSGSPTTTPSLGISVVSNKLIQVYATDMCTQNAGETCYFYGGQRVLFDDGSVLLTGNFQYNYVNGTNTDIDQNTATLFIPPTHSTDALQLSLYVARGAGYKALYLVWNRNPESVKLIADTTGNLSPYDVGDETITSPNIISW